MRFDFAQRHISNTMGLGATYAPSVGDPVSLQVVRQGGGVPSVGGLVGERTAFHVLREDVAAPEPGAVITLDGTAYNIDLVQPVLNDSHQLKWALEASWSLALAYHCVSGSGTAMAPPSVYGPSPPVITAAGATLSVSGSYIVGALSAGDTLTVRGEVYTVTATATAANNSFSAVPVTPAPDVSIAPGDAVTFSFARVVSVRAGVSSYSADQLLGGIQTGDIRVSLPAYEANLLPSTPKTGDRLSGVPGFDRALNVIHVNRGYDGSEVVGYEIQCRG